MERHIPLTEENIYSLYLDESEAKTYRIPIYQRNYAWAEDEISALVNDIADSMRMDQSRPYYIGTLVTFHRGGRDYEVIDGQQRLTTIFLILKALEFQHTASELTYTSRSKSVRTLDNLPESTIGGDTGISEGFFHARKAILSLGDDVSSFKNYFLEKVKIIHYEVPKDVDLNHYFEVMNSRGEQLEKHEIVKALLNSYLNGTQSAHTEMATFNRIWEAVSQMDTYIQQAFPATEVFGANLNVFLPDSFYGIPSEKPSAGKASILSMLENTAIENKTNEDDEEEKQMFQPIIDFPNFLLIVLKITLFQDYFTIYQHINRLRKFTLDDKELLNLFELTLKLISDPDKQRLFVKKFTFSLLKSKYLLDNFIVHHTPGEEISGKNPWNLKKYFKSGKNNKPKNLAYRPKTMAPDDDDSEELSEDLKDLQDELVHLLSMFEVSYTPRQRKNYLFYCLYYLGSTSEGQPQIASTIPDLGPYRDFLRNLAQKYFYDIYLGAASRLSTRQPGPDTFDNIILKENRIQLSLAKTHYAVTDFTDTYYQGFSDIPLFIFNYTDYCIWHKYLVTLRGEKKAKGSPLRRSFFEDTLGCSDFELEPFNEFYFSRSRRSLEHFYPQAKAKNPDDPQYKDAIENGIILTPEEINCFGNFAMISSNFNSSGSNWDPYGKLTHYVDEKTNPVGVASLKFKIMLRIVSDNRLKRPDAPQSQLWLFPDILSHQDYMLDILFPNH